MEIWISGDTEVAFTLAQWHSDDRLVEFATGTNAFIWPVLCHSEIWSVIRNDSSGSLTFQKSWPIYPKERHGLFEKFGIRLEILEILKLFGEEISMKPPKDCIAV